MTYAEFNKTYAWMMKHYPTMQRYCRAETHNPIGAQTTTRYEKRGSRWVETSRETYALTAESYCNSVDAVWFFRGVGGTERVEMAYTRAGYLPVKITSISPDKQIRIIRTFDPED